MSPRLVEFVPFAEVEHHLFRVGKAVLEVDEVEHEVADGIEDNILSQNFRNSHSLALLASFVSFASCASVPSL